MSVNGYLTELASAALLKGLQKANINRSLELLKRRLDSHFGADIKEHFAFGSYTRGTILPRSMDDDSDVDYMIVFTNTDRKPQAYLDRLRTFVNNYYSQSEIVQSHPTIVLTLNHIKFELVPAIRGLFSVLLIPSRGASGAQSWMSTNPNGFNSELTEANRNNKDLIKPLVRMLKYWNARSGHVFESFELEKKIVGFSFPLSGLFGWNLKQYFFDSAESLAVGWLDAQWKKDAIDRLHTVIKEIKAFEARQNVESAENRLIKLLPWVE